MLHTRDELDDDLSLAVLTEAATVVRDIELVLERATITRNTHNVVDVDLRRVGQVNCALLSELVGHFAEVDDIFTESEGGSYYVALERQGEHLGAAFEREAESL